MTPSSVSLRNVLVHQLLVLLLAIRSWFLSWETPERGKQHLPKVEVTEPQVRGIEGHRGENNCWFYFWWLIIHLAKKRGRGNAGGYGERNLKVCGR